MSNTSSKDYGLDSQRTLGYRPTKITFREYDKKIINFALDSSTGIRYWIITMNGRNKTQS
jgi:hypothetical protein